MKNIKCGFTLLINPSRSSSRSFVSATQPNFCSRSPDLRPSGFTLAETLITLVIIGVIAAITVPTLIAKYQKEQTVVRLKKAYSTLAQVTNQINAEEGIPRADKGGWATSNEAVYSLYKKKLFSAKECLNGNGCWYVGTIKNLNGDDHNNFDSSTFPKLILADGSLISFFEIHDDCYEFGCAWFWIDVNGVKKPNTWGKDMFQFYVTENNGLKPRGCDRTTFDTRGHNATCQVLREGAINYY